MYKNILCLHTLLLINGVSVQQHMGSLYTVWQDEKQIDTARIEAFDQICGKFNIEKVKTI